MQFSGHSLWNELERKFTTRHQFLPLRPALLFMYLYRPTLSEMNDTSYNGSRHALGQTKRSAYIHNGDCPLNLCLPNTVQRFFLGFVWYVQFLSCDTVLNSDGTCTAC
eukprot:scpid70068/ scgid20430/ 